MMGIESSKTCAVTGHRAVGADLSREKLKKALLELINKGVDSFLVGMAVGFDTICFNVLEELRKDFNIKIIACIPCPNQDKNFSQKQKIEYERMNDVSDRRLLISNSYTSGCMLKRNRFMVDNSDYLVCYLRDNKGGTFYTVNYATSKNKTIVRV